MKVCVKIIISVLILCMVFLSGCAGRNLPSLLNGDNICFPGVEWFCSPEELFDALNLTEDDITAEEDANTYRLITKNVKLFGNEEGIVFTFVREGEGSLVLINIRVLYDESVDMAEIREKVENSLGPPQEEPGGKMDLQLTTNDELTELERSELSGHIVLWNSKTTISYPDKSQILPATNLVWSDDQRVWLLGSAEANIPKAGVLFFSAAYIPGD